MKVIQKNRYDEKIAKLSIETKFIYLWYMSWNATLFENSYEFGLTKGLGLVEGMYLN